MSRGDTRLSTRPHAALCIGGGQGMAMIIERLN
jgi:acetyl-CoA acetyltransferase